MQCVPRTFRKNEGISIAVRVGGGGSGGSFGCGAGRNRIHTCALDICVWDVALGEDMRMHVWGDDMCMHVGAGWRGLVG